MFGKSEDASGLVAGIGLVIGTVVWAVTSIALFGWVLSILWGWFVVPFGIRSISLLEAVGISLVVGLLTHQAVPSPSSGDGGIVPAIARAIAATWIRPLFALVLGYAVHLLM